MLLKFAAGFSRLITYPLTQRAPSFQPLLFLAPNEYYSGLNWYRTIRSYLYLASILPKVLHRLQISRKKTGWNRESHSTDIVEAVFNNLKTYTHPQFSFDARTKIEKLRPQIAQNLLLTRIKLQNTIESKKTVWTGLWRCASLADDSSITYTPNY